MNNEKLLDNRSEEFSAKEKLGTPCQQEISQNCGFSIYQQYARGKIKKLQKKYKRPENCSQLSAPKVNSEVRNENLLTPNRMTDISLCKIQLLNVSAAYAITGYKIDLSRELLTPLIDALTFLGQAASDTNQFRTDIIKPRLPGRMRQMAKIFPNGSEMLFGNDLNKRITLIINTSNALLTKPSHNVVSNKPATNQTGKHTTYQHHQNDNQNPKNLHPSRKSSATGRRGNRQRNNGFYRNLKK